jgi:hypothetical protein
MKMNINKHAKSTCFDACKKIMWLGIAVLCFSTSFAQVGIGTASPNTDAALDITSTDKGLLIPRLELSDPSSEAPLTAHVSGMLVYNTKDDPSADLFPGFYYNDGSKWVLLLTTENIATVTVPKFTRVVYVNNADPNNATIFDSDPAAQTNDTNLQVDQQNLYIGSTGSGFIWDGSEYISFTMDDVVPWNLRGSNVNAGNNKDAQIERYGEMFIKNIRFGRGNSSVPTNVLAGAGGALGVSSGDKNAALGFFSLGTNTTGSNNVAAGFSSLAQNQTGSDNVALARASLRHVTGNYNVGVGMQALSSANLTGQENVGIGWLTGGNTTGTSSNNTFIGSTAGRFLANGNNNTGIGSGASFANNSASNQVSIQNSLFAVEADATDPANPSGSWGVNRAAPQSTFDVGGSFGANIRVESTSYTMSDEDHTIIMTANTQTVTLPAPSNRRIVYIRNAAASGGIDVTGDIDGTSSSTITILSGKSRRLQSDGSTWHQVGGLQ